MTVAFIGHRKLSRVECLEEKLFSLILELIAEEKADTFLFGSRSEFDDLCYKIVTELQKTYPFIRRVYYRGEYEFISEQYSEYLLTMYEETVFPEKVHNAGILAYIKRNEAMIDASDKLVVYYNDKANFSSKSGTKIAVEYAIRKRKNISNIFTETLK